MTTSDGSGALPDHDVSGPSTVALWSARADGILLTVIGCGLAALLAWADLPTSTRIDFMIILGAVSVAGCARALRIGLYAGEDSLIIRNFFRSHRFQWQEVSRFADGSVWVISLSGGGL